MFKPFSIVVMAAFLSLPVQAGADALAQLRALGPAPEGLSIELRAVDVQSASAAADGVLRPGDRIAFSLSGVENATLFVLNMDAAGAVQMIYPNRFAPRPGPQTSGLRRMPQKRPRPRAGS